MQGRKKPHPGEVLGVPQKDGPLLSDAVAMVELHQLVQGGEELVPHVVLTTAILQYLEVLNMVPVAVKETSSKVISQLTGIIPVDQRITASVWLEIKPPHSRL